MSQTSPETETAKLAEEFTKWVEQYATKVCPPGCIPTRGQEREINLFARIAIALRSSGHAQRPLTAEDVYANCETTLIGFRDELTERDIKFICDQVSRKVILALSSTDREASK